MDHLRLMYSFLLFAGGVWVLWAYFVKGSWRKALSKVPARVSLDAMAWVLLAWGLQLPLQAALEPFLLQIGPSYAYLTRALLYHTYWLLWAWGLQTPKMQQCNRAENLKKGPQHPKSKTWAQQTQGLLRFLRTLPEAAMLSLALQPLLWSTSVFWEGLLQLSYRICHLPLDLPKQAWAFLLETSAASEVGFKGLFALTTWILGPWAEEWLFRGMLYPALKGFCSPLKAATLTALVFALMHAHLASFLPLCLMSLFLTLIYEHRGRLALCVATHAFWNVGATLGHTLFMLN